MDHFSRAELFPVPDFPVFVNSDHWHRGTGGSVRHSHDFFEIVLVARGYGEHRLGEGQSYGVMQGDLFAIDPGEFHSYANGHDILLYNVLFETEFLQPEWRELSIFPVMTRIASSPARKYHLNTFERQNAENLLREIINEIALRRPAFRIRVRALLLEFLVLAARAEERAWHIRDRRQEAVHRAVVFMEEHLAEDISLLDISRHAGLGRNYFREFFQQETGSPPWHYFLKLRIESVKKLLTSGDMPLQEAALRSGFCDQSYMTRLFRKFEGTTPRDFRNTLRRLPGN